MNSSVKTIIFWIVIIVSATLLWQVIKSGNRAGQQAREISYSQFLSQVDAGNVASVRISKTRANGIYRDGGSFLVIVPASQDLMLQLLRQKNVEIRYIEQNDSSANWLVNLLPLVLLAALWYFMIRQMRMRSKAQVAGGSSLPGQNK